MAEVNNEISVISHLIQVEKAASSLIDDAVKEAEMRLSQARSESNQQFKDKYDKVVATLEEEYNHNIQKLQSEHDEKVQSFKDSLSSQNQDKQAFQSLLNELLFQSN